MLLLREMCNKAVHILAHFTCLCAYVTVSLFTLTAVIVFSVEDKRVIKWSR